MTCTQACRITRDAILRCRTVCPALDFDLRPSLIDCARLTASWLSWLSIGPARSASRITNVMYDPQLSTKYRGNSHDHWKPPTDNVNKQSPSMLGYRRRCTPHTVMFQSMLDSYGPTQHVNTFTRGAMHIVDVVITPSEYPASINVEPPTLSDHSFIDRGLQFKSAIQPRSTDYHRSSSPKAD